MREHLTDQKKLLLVGGGHSHVMVVKMCGKKPVPGVKTILISPDVYTPYSGMLPGLIAGHHSYDDCHIDLPRLCRNSGVHFICDAVAGIHPDSPKTVCLRDSFGQIKFDLLSVDIGSEPALDNIPGARNFGCAIKPIKNFLFHWHTWLKLHAESKINKHIIVVGGGAAGIEVLLAMQYRLQNTTSIRTKFTLICADQTILSSHNHLVQNYFQRLLRSRGVSIISGTHVTSIDKQYLQLNNGLTIDYGFTVWAIHAAAQSWPATNGLKCDDLGFIEVDQCLRSISHSNIFAAGDCAAFTPCALPKAGVYAVRQGPVLFRNIVATFMQRSLKPFKPQRHFLSLLTTGGRRAVASRGVFCLQGKWVWHWKNYIDRKFMQRFKPN